MKFTPEVVAALEVLRAAAENDFERHRLDVLERDLTAPPVVEVLDENRQRFESVVYRKKSSGHYSQYTPIHREVWRYYFGEIPEGYEIHHVDEDKANNAISNLQCLSKADHNRIHLSRLRKTAKQTEHVCEYCGKIYLQDNFGIRKFCTVECAQKAQAENRVIEKTCEVCGAIFQTNDSRVKCCSVSCGNKLGHSLRGTSKEKTCPICGKIFTPQRARQQCCSKTCGYKFRNKKS